MYRIIQPTKDTYITNKIVGQIRVTDANVGQAGTVDLFKLYDENTIAGEDYPIELSRALIYFDLTPIREMSQSTLDITSSTFRCHLKLSDVYAGQTTPSNFSLIVYPLSQSFDEGVGRDVVRFEDVDVCNFITASVSSNTNLWFISGANAMGLLGSNNIDIISSGNLNDGNGIVNLFVTQSFSTGDEDLFVDVTKIISGTIAGLIPDCGFRVSYSGSQETDAKTRFVKRFASRNTTNTSKRPKLIVTFNDTISDDHELFYFNTTGSIFLNNYVRGNPSNLISGSSSTPIEGHNCLLVKLQTGSFTQYSTGSQIKFGPNFQTGIYSASFAINEFNPLISQHIAASGSVTFNEIWSSFDGTVAYYSGSLNITRSERTSFIQTPERYFVNITNMRPFYKNDELIRFRMFIQDFNQSVVYAKIPIENTGIVVDRCYYRIRDFESDEEIVPFSDPGTLTSNDATAHYFDFYMSTLPKGRTYTFDFKIINKGLEIIINDVAAKFRVE